MYLNTLHLVHFKQFIDIEVNFHHGLNFIIGNNGEGKSNLLEAIQNITIQNDAQERIKLLQNNSGESYIYFQFNEIDIKKHLTQKYEDFYINGTKISFNQLQQQLEINGLNNLQIVQQNDQNLVKCIQDLYEVQNFESRQKENRNLLNKANIKQCEIQTKLYANNNQLEKLLVQKSEYQQFLDFQNQKLETEASIIQFDLQECITNQDEIEQKYSLKQQQYEDYLKQLNIQNKHILSINEIIREQEILLNQKQQIINSLKESKFTLSDLINQSPDFIISVQSQTQNVENVDNQLNDIQDQLHESKLQLQQFKSIQQQLMVKLSTFENIENLDQYKEKVELDIKQINKTILINTKSSQQYQLELSSLIQPQEPIFTSKKQDYAINIQKQSNIQLFIDKLKKQKQNTLFDLQRSQSELNRQLPSQVAYPIQYLQSVINKNKSKYENKVFGPLYQLLKFDKEIQNIVDAAIGMTLFSIVVDTEQTALQLIDIFNVESQIDKDLINAKINFLPLSNFNQQIKDLQLPNDSIQLCRLLQVNSNFQQLINQLYGQVVICKSMQVARQLSQQFNIDCYTIDGDSVSQSGLVVGGCRNTTKIKSIMDVVSINDQLQSILLDLQKQQLIYDQQSIFIQNLSQEILLDEKQLQEHVGEVTDYRNKKYLLNQNIQQLEKIIQDDSLKLKGLVQERNALSQIDQSQTQQSVEELIIQKNFNSNQIADLQVQLFQLEKKEEYLLEKQQLQLDKKNELQIQLDIQMSKLKRSFQSLNLPDITSPSEALELAQRISNDLQIQIRDLNEDIFKLNSSFQNNYQILQNAQKEQYSLQQSQLSLNQELSIITQTKGDINQSINLLEMQLLNLPSPLKFQTRSEAVCFAGKIQTQMLQFNSINKMALDQYTLQKSKLNSGWTKFENLKQNQQSLESQVNIAEIRFSTAFKDTLNSVNKYYCQYLQFLINCTGYIEIQNDDVNLIVNTPGNPSSGQQAAARVSYILALQSNSPILVIDEIDAHLDLNTKIKFGKLLQQVSLKSQIFCVSFCNEILNFANKVFKVHEGNVLEVFY